MVRGLNSRVIGAGIVGISLVAGAWVLNSLQSAPLSADSVLSVSTTPAPLRAPIPVADANNDGIEDWKEPLLTAEPLILTNNATYTRSNTLTEQMGIRLMERLILTKGTSEEAGSVSGEIAEEVFTESLSAVQDAPYTNLDIILLPDSSPISVRVYVNDVALILKKNDQVNLPHNLRVFELSLLQQDPSAQQNLVAIAAMYQKNCLDLLALPVPVPVRSEHLLLVNSMCTMSKNMTSMVNATTDPALALLRLKRYEVDEQALAQAVATLRDMITRQPFTLDETDAASVFLSFGR